MKQNFKYIRQLPQPLLESIVQNRCLPFIGSGFSKNADIPKGMKMLNWEELGRKFANLLTDYVFSSAIDAISSYEYSYGRSSMVEKMKDLLLNGKVRPGTTHKAFCQLPFDIVCTTNFDRLIEDTFSLLKRPCNVTYRESQLTISPSKDEVTLLKLHGDIYDPESLVATEEDYDKFINTHPLLATFLSNLLITRTPIFIGYSLDDADFRLIWQILKNRLGNLRRQAYTLKVGCSEMEIKRYERRGVKVINLNGNPKDYSLIFEEMFNEIKLYWNESVKIVSESETQSALIQSSNSTNRLCFFAVPFRHMPFYKDYIFPIAIKYGFIPITVDSVVEVSDSVMAKITSLISKSNIFVVDLSTPNTVYEFGLIMSQRDVKPYVIVLNDEKSNLNFSNLELPIRTINKPANFYEQPENVIYEIENFFVEIAHRISKSSKGEPERLLNDKQFKTAILSAVTLLETTLLEVIKKHTNLDYRLRGIFSLNRVAKEISIITVDEYNKINEWTKVRNLIAHSPYEPNEEQAKKVVEGIMELIKKISGNN